MRTFICCSHKVETLLLLGLSKIQMMALAQVSSENFKLVWLLLHQRVSVRVFNYIIMPERSKVHLAAGCGLQLAEAEHQRDEGADGHEDRQHGGAVVLGVGVSHAGAARLPASSGRLLKGRDFSLFSLCVNGATNGLMLCRIFCSP